MRNDYPFPMAAASHIVIRLRTGLVIAPDSGTRRRVARAILSRGRPFGLFGFRVADTHAHIGVLAGKPGATELARRIEISRSLARPHRPGFAHCYVKPVQTQSHLENLFYYLLEQEEHHGIRMDPAHQGSILQDLLGLRVTGAYVIENVRRALPRVTRKSLLARSGFPNVVPADWPLESLADAAAAAVCLLDLRLRRKCSSDVRAARTAAAAIVGGRLRRVQVAKLLNTSRATLHRDAQQTPDPAVVSAIRLQLGLRAMSLPDYGTA